jgi:acetyltransferase-like isoleucine patch superfamily enzyme
MKSLPLSTHRIGLRHVRQIPPVLNALVRLRKATVVGHRVRVWGRPIVANYGDMVFGDRVRIRSIVSPSEFVSMWGGRLEIGEGTFVNYGCAFSANKLIKIGKDCMIGTHCIVMDNDYHHIDVDKRDLRPPSQPIIIGDNVWIGARVTILKGVHIGDYAVIGAGSVVTRDIPPYCVAAGVPARVVRHIAH